LSQQTLKFQVNLFGHERIDLLQIKSV